ncbi:ubiquinol-cytochrome c reductase cytochrome b subunit [Streptomyces armeniacus]|uniref:Cytochrome bc1 complex cytochrome b subunit n=1 Tax=Streptomyces armeniacus TaxID=83291 RepID=A0A345XQT4_9ACTN|nr:ubiquinol-cytochrome c reductase cytochrome b subunit [Streptomyces armeniacus]AXK34000.1 ubiquinol-cytochrome c reductase cytochrome b subunit [Streptomyces armeniacus]
MRRRAEKRRTGNGDERVLRALDSRLPVAEGSRVLVRKAFPDHWSFLLGELALYSLVVLVLTGTYLTLFFNPSMSEIVYRGSYEPLRGVHMSEAYASTLRISFDVRGGLLVRQIHHWAALLFLSAIGLHLLRIFFTGAFRRPRELNWVIGVTLFVLALLEGFTGYSLPDDLLSGTGLKIAHGIMLSIPVVGSYLAFFAFGGEYPGHDIIPRLYVTHILLVPGILIALVVVHLILVVQLKHTQWARPGATNRNVVGQPMVPQFAAKSTGLFFAVFGVVTLLAGTAQINPVYAYGPYDPGQVSTGSQPDWYVGFLEGSLRLMPPFETTLWGHTVMWNVLVPAVILPGLLFLALYVYPFTERWLTGDHGEHHLSERPRNRPVRTGLGAGALTFYAVLLIAGGNDVIADLFEISLNGLTWALRAALVVAPVAAYLLTKRLCTALQAHERDRFTEGDETGDVYQTVEGGMVEGHSRMPAREQYALLVREEPRALPGGQSESRAGRVRAALSGWFHSGHVRVPVTARQRREIEARTAPPALGGPDRPEEPERPEAERRR